MLFQEIRKVIAFYQKTDILDSVDMDKPLCDSQMMELLPHKEQADVLSLTQGNYADQISIQITSPKRHLALTTGNEFLYT